MNRVINTAAELDTLPTGSVVRSDEHEYGEPIYVRQEESWYAGWGWECPVLPLLPVTVLHDPSAPSATREDVEHIARTLAETTALSGADAHLIVQAALALSAPSATREDVEALIDDLLTEAGDAAPEVPDAYREGVVAGLRQAVEMARARFTITPRTDR